MLVGRVFRVFGIVLFIAGAGFCIGVWFGLFRTFPYAGVVAMLVGTTIGWFGKSLAAGTLKDEIKGRMREEASETLRLRTRPSGVTAALVVIGFTLAVVAGVVVWWVLTQNSS